jgi:hypothetical protein
MLMELAVAGVLVGALLVVCLQLVAAAAGQRRAADLRQCALLELGNVMEQVTARPWAELTAAALSREKLSPPAARQMPGAELKIEVFTPAGEPGTKRITAAIGWQDRSGQLFAPLTLTAWRHQILERRPNAGNR